MVIDVLRGIGLGIDVVILACLAAWVLAAGLLVAILIVVLISRRSPAAVRELFRHTVAAGSSPALLHTGHRGRGGARSGPRCGNSGRPIPASTTTRSWTAPGSRSRPTP
jgi:hypothetical protein